MLILRNDLLDQLKALYTKYNGVMGPVNLFGIEDETDQKEDVFNDWLGLNIGTQVWIWKGTCNPGIKAMQDHPDGAGHMAFGFQKDIWCFDVHAPNIPSWSHRALCQRPARGTGVIKFWRDKNKHFIYDPDTDKIEESKECYMNFHRASAAQDVSTIGVYSAGCQVSQNVTDFTTILTQIETVPEVRTNIQKYLFSYLLTNKTEWNELNI